MKINMVKCHHCLPLVLLPVVFGVDSQKDILDALWEWHQSDKIKTNTRLKKQHDSPHFYTSAYVVKQNEMNPSV